jgi:hypothetical protein
MFRDRLNKNATNVAAFNLMELQLNPSLTPCSLYERHVIPTKHKRAGVSEFFFHRPYFNLTRFSLCVYSSKLFEKVANVNTANYVVSTYTQHDKQQAVDAVHTLERSFTSATLCICQNRRRGKNQQCFLNIRLLVHAIQ